VAEKTEGAGREAPERAVESVATEEGAQAKNFRRKKKPNLGKRCFVLPGVGKWAVGRKVLGSGHAGATEYRGGEGQKPGKELGGPCQVGGERTSSAPPGFRGTKIWIQIKGRIIGRVGGRRGLTLTEMKNKDSENGWLTTSTELWRKTRSIQRRSYNWL